MPDLDERFSAFSRTRTPDLWSEIEGRHPRFSTAPPARRRVLAAVVATVVAAGGIGLAALTFGGAGTRRTIDAPGSAFVNGAIAYASNGDTWLVRPDGSGATKLTIDVPGSVGGLSWSPDGTRIVFDVNSYPEGGAPKGGFFDIYAANADGSAPVRLTHDRDSRLPAWSPDGTRIAYTRQGSDGGSQIYAMDADGSNALALTSGPAFNVRPEWSPDGTRIAFESVIDADSDVYVMRSDGSAPTRLTDDPAWDGSPVWSPTGDRIAFASDRSPPGIYVMNADGSDERLLEADGDVANLGLSWSPDGGFLAFTSSRGPGFGRAVYVLDLSTDAVTQITDRGLVWGPSWQPVPATAESPAPSQSSVLSASVVDTFQVGKDVRSVVYGEGSVWVADSNAEGTSKGRIVRMDPVTHEVQAEIPVDVIPTWEVGGGAMVTDGGDLWVTGALDHGPAGAVDAAVIRIDTATNEVVQTIEVGGEFGADLTFLDGQLWVLVFGSGIDGHGMGVLRVDPATGEVLERFGLDPDWAHTLVAADGRLIVLVGGADAVNVDGRVIEIDPVAGAVSGIDVPSDAFTPMPVLWRGQVWVSLDPGFARFEPLVEGFTDPPVVLPKRFSDCCGFLEGDDRGIWFLSLAPNGTDRQLNLFDPETSEVAELATLDQGAPVAMAVAPNAVWILNYEGTLTQVELR